MKFIKKFKSIAYWPIGTIPSLNDKSSDLHDTEEAADGVCNLLIERGFGGDRKVFPLYTLVEVVRSTDAWLDVYPMIKVLDPDGWDRSPDRFEKSWNELITKSEFSYRVSESTCEIKKSDKISEDLMLIGSFLFVDFVDTLSESSLKDAIQDRIVSISNERKIFKSEMERLYKKYKVASSVADSYASILSEHNLL